MQCLESVTALGSWPLILIAGAVFYVCGRVRPLRSLGLWPHRRQSTLVESSGQLGRRRWVRH